MELKIHSFVAAWVEFTPALEDVPAIKITPIRRKECRGDRLEGEDGENTVTPDLCHAIFKDIMQLYLRVLDQILRQRRMKSYEIGDRCHASY